ncbi:hypothetical protein JR316_0005609 [Psilocybe cubensis]|uniref:Uncharacterized protein n=2 Tax=Psilocybe cubensis TaxID=181762 RepID=A0ACB8GZA6_PSICU|nr:hypothetical protein JR316_0005609 [Psilocybe cubensis]KAH9481090.1 hypothetical protein JR316_0005609 [Psilocybe cubensis]
MIAIVSAVFLASVLIHGTIAQSYPPPIWYFPFRVTLANGQGNADPSRTTSFADNVFVDIDLTQPFSLMSWISVSDIGSTFWRAALSIESPDATSALFRIALPPNQMNFNVAWMQSAQNRGGAINTTVVAPGPNVQFHLAMVKDGNAIAFYMNGARTSSISLSSQIFNPANFVASQKQVVLGRTRLDGNTDRSQWNGILRDVYLFDFALDDAEVEEEYQATLLE